MGAVWCTVVVVVVVSLLDCRQTRACLCAIALSGRRGLNANEWDTRRRRSRKGCDSDSSLLSMMCTIRAMLITKHNTRHETQRLESKRQQREEQKSPAVAFYICENSCVHCARCCCRGLVFDVSDTDRGAGVSFFFQRAEQRQSFSNSLVAPQSLHTCAAYLAAFFMCLGCCLFFKRLYRF